MRVSLLLFNIFLFMIYMVPITIGSISYLFSKNKAYLYLVVLFIFYELENLIICMTEYDTVFARYYDHTFMSVPTIRTVLFTGVLFCMLLVNNTILNDTKNDRFLILLASIILFMLFIPMMENGPWKVFIYYTPCQLYSFALGWHGLRRMKRHPDLLEGRFRKLYRLNLVMVMLFSVAIIIEDSIVIFHFDNYGDTSIHITNRSYSENVMTLWFIVAMLWAVVPIIRQSVSPLVSMVPESPQQPEPEPEEVAIDLPIPDPDVAPLPEPAEITLHHSKFDAFCRHYQLTTREQDILECILLDKNNSEISSELYISLGTAKAHIHNIFMKLEVNKRQQLKELYLKFEG